MKKGDEVYFFNSKKELKRGIIIRKEKGGFVIKTGNGIYRRKFSNIGKVRK